MVGPERVVVLGCAGTGTTVFARALAGRLDCPFIVLDNLGDQDRKGEQITEFRTRLLALHAPDAWVSDGNFALVSFDIRLPRATAIIWLDRPRWLCALRATLRVFGVQQTHRWRDLAKVLAFVWRFDRVNRPRIEAARQRYGAHVPVVHLRNDREVREFLGRTGRPDRAA